ncbi:MAG: hypothetical protein HXX14_01095 [Bacteroidetes bacterium]|nr:hypothetical protein [Bacteroidota bacterium]
MKKISQIILFLLLSITVKSQQINNSISLDTLSRHSKLAAIELKKAATMAQVGIGLEVVGGSAIAYSILRSAPDKDGKIAGPNQKTRNIIGIGGSVLALLGFYIHIDSFTHIQNAGLILNNESIGISVSF